MSTLSIAAFLTLLGANTVPALLPVQGYVTDADGTPIDGMAAISVTLYPAETSTTTLFTETHNVLVEQGSFSIYLGSVQLLDIRMFEEQRTMYMSIAVNGSALEPRVQLASAPYAAFAHSALEAKTLDGYSASSFAVALHRHSWSELMAIPNDIADGDDVLTQIQVENYAAAICYDTEAELTTALDDNYVNEAQNNSVSSAMITDGTIQRADIATGVSGTVVQERTSLLQTGTAQTADCPTGYALTGGACLCSDNAFATQPIAESRPSGIINGRNWYCRCVNPSHLASAAAYCARVWP